MKTVKLTDEIYELAGQYLFEYGDSVDEVVRSAVLFLAGKLRYKHRRPKPFAVRFWSKVLLAGPNDCWLWQGRKQNQYGALSTSLNGARKHLRAHRIAWTLKHGPIPKGMFVCHHCDNPPCCNPSHLFLGTAADNNADTRAKGRHRSGSRPGRLRPVEQNPIGTRNGRAKLQEREVEEILSLVADGVPKAKVGRTYGVSATAVHLIAKGENWSHVRGNRATLPDAPTALRGYLSFLTREDVEMIRFAYSTGRFSQKEIATCYAISHSSVSGIIRGKHWAHVPLPGEAATEFEAHRE